MYIHEHKSKTMCNSYGNRICSGKADLQRTVKGHGKSSQDYRQEMSSCVDKIVSCLAAGARKQEADAS